MVYINPPSGGVYYRCTVLSMEWPRPYLKKAEKRQASGGAIKSTAEFVVSPKEWSGLNVSRNMGPW